MADFENGVQALLIFTSYIAALHHS